MTLKNYIKQKIKEDTDNCSDDVIIASFEQKAEEYTDKSMPWILRITSEDLGIPEDKLLEVLNKHYSSGEAQDDRPN